MCSGDLFDFPTVKQYLERVYGMYINTGFFTVGDEGETYGVFVFMSSPNTSASAISYRATWTMRARYE